MSAVRDYQQRALSGVRTKRVVNIGDLGVVGAQVPQPATRQQTAVRTVARAPTAAGPVFTPKVQLKTGSVHFPSSAPSTPAPMRVFAPNAAVTSAGGGGGGAPDDSAPMQDDMIAPQQTAIPTPSSFVGDAADSTLIASAVAAHAIPDGVFGFPYVGVAHALGEINPAAGLVEQAAFSLNVGSGPKPDAPTSGLSQTGMIVLGVAALGLAGYGVYRVTRKRGRRR